ncbi:hypothetical protein AK812_SmicGene44642, partial [Symbiodinium microadriaticum]
MALRRKSLAKCTCARPRSFDAKRSHRAPRGCFFLPPCARRPPPGHAAGVRVTTMALPGLNLTGLLPDERALVAGTDRE